MPKFTVETKYLSHTDISDVSDTIVTIKDFQQETLGMGAQAQEKWVLYFRENKKGLVLNKTNGKILVKDGVHCPVRAGRVLRYAGRG